MNRSDGTWRWRPPRDSLGCCSARAVATSLLFLIPSLAHAQQRQAATVPVRDVGPLSSRCSVTLGQPLYRTGGMGGAHDFQLIMDGTFMTGGRVAVADANAHQVVVLRADGSVERIVGGPGQGPGEFRWIASVHHLGGDTLLVEDDGNARMSIFHEGRLVRSYPAREFSVSQGLLAMGVAGRDLIMRSDAYIVADFPGEWMQAHVVRHRVDSQVWDTLTAYDRARRMPAAGVPNPLGPSGRTGLTKGAVLLSRGDRPQVEVLDLATGARRIVRWQEAPRPVTDQLWDESAAFHRARATRAGRSEAEIERSLRTMRGQIQGPAPYVERVVGDDEGRIWASDAAGDYRHFPRYRVFARDGTWLGWARMPPRFHILAIAEGHILGVFRDEWDVESVAKIPFSFAGGC